MTKTVIRNCRPVLSDSVADLSDILIENGHIVDILSAGTVAPDYKTIDAKGMYISAGFVDIHQHGGGGSDYMDSDADTYKNALEAHLRHGATSVMPTLLSASYEHTVGAIKSYVKATQDKRIRTNLLGIHIEGPYISKAQAGAQKPEHIRDFDPQEYRSIYEASEGTIKRWSVAPEIPGAKAFASFANQNDIVLSIAHSDADFDTVVEAFDWGFCHATHLYSGMSTIFRRGGFRIAGVVEAAYYLDDMNVEIIADGCHLPLSVLKLVTKCKKNGTVAVITDAMRAAGENVTESFLGNCDDPLPVVIEDGVAKMLSREAFAGSICTTDRLVKTMLSAGLTLPQAVKMATVNPLKMMRIDAKKGEIKPGYDADLCLFDEDINVHAVLVGGNYISCI